MKDLIKKYKGTDLELPKGVSALGKKAWEVVVRVLEENEATYTGGCRVFYSRKEWRERKEIYGINSELVIVYDGGDHAPFFNYSYECYSLMEKMEKALRKAGVYTEGLYGWCSGVYAC